MVMAGFGTKSEYDVASLCVGMMLMGSALC
jgi:hypothetical protein